MLEGAGSGESVIDGSQSHRVPFPDTAVAISNVTIQNGSGASPGGGGIRNSGTLALTNCALRNNWSSGGGFFHPNGGGILNDGGVLTVTNCTLNGNSSVGGDGGGLVTFGGSVKLTSAP